MDHERMKETQDAWDALAAGDPGPAFDALSESVSVDNGPGAGPWRHIEGLWRRDGRVDVCRAPGGIQRQPQRVWGMKSLRR
jgi:hypothetical protein